MADRYKAMELARTFWDSLGRGNLEACFATLADDIVRIGTNERDPHSIIRGKETYKKFLANLHATMPAYDNITHEVSGTDDGKHAYIHVTEIIAVEPHSTETFEAHVVMIMTINDDDLISVIDIYWKNPPVDYEWIHGRSADLMKVIEDHYD